MSARYVTYDVPLAALLHVGHTAHDVLVLREHMGHYQIRLPEGAAEGTRIVIAKGTRVLKPGTTTSVPMGLIELRSP